MPIVYVKSLIINSEKRKCLKFAWIQKHFSAIVFAIWSCQKFVVILHRFSR